MSEEKTKYLDVKKITRWQWVTSQFQVMKLGDKLGFMQVPREQNGFDRLALEYTCKYLDAVKTDME